MAAGLSGGQVQAQFIPATETVFPHRFSSLDTCDGVITVDLPRSHTEFG